MSQSALRASLRGCSIRRCSAGMSASLLVFPPKIAPSSQGPRSRRAAGVGDVAEERGGCAALFEEGAADPEQFAAWAVRFWEPDADYYPARKFPEATPCHGREEI